MKTCLCLLALLCSFAPATDGQQPNSDSRTFPTPTCFLKAGKFLELGESERLSYTTGLLDGFYGSGMFAASDDSVASLNSCTKGMDSKQVTAIVLKYVSDHPNGGTCR